MRLVVCPERKGGKDSLFGGGCCVLVELIDGFKEFHAHLPPPFFFVDAFFVVLATFFFGLLNGGSCAAR